jgi:GT2 family glycosyltransferase/glycosyltransferase involved in cell wall biosynthesis
MAAGHAGNARAWFGRAVRLAPGDPHARLLLASVLTGKHDDRALAILLDVADEHDLPEAHLGAALIQLRAGKAAAAASSLAALLRRLAPPLQGQDFAHGATAIARAAGAPGWIGLRPDGTVLLGIERAALAGLALRAGPQHIATGLARDENGVFILDLPAGWRTAGAVSALVDGVPLLGSPIDPAPFGRAFGFVEAHEGGLRGWALLPAAPQVEPRLELLPAAVRGAGGWPLLLGGWNPPAPAPRGAFGFRLPREALPAAGPLSVCGPDGVHLSGSPLDPGAEQHAAAAAATALRALTQGGGPDDAERRPVPATAPDFWRPLHAAPPPPRSPAMPRRAARHCAAAVVIPVFRGAPDLEACLASLRTSRPAGTRVVVVDDASPDPALRALAAAAATRGEVELLTMDRNHGFPGAANAGLRHVAGHDAILLNSDTLLPPGWLDRLRAAADAAPDIGSVTPLSNDATILSYPSAEGGNPIPDLEGVHRLDARCRAANPAAVAEIPTGIGFCMLLRQDCLAEVGLLREDVFAQGYGEENDWCLRARRLGWRHVAALDVFVGHVGGRSFGPAKMALTARNGAVLNRLHPGYDALIGDFLRRDPLATARRRIDIGRWAEERAAGGAIILVGHGRGGGVGRHLRERATAIAALGLRPVMLVPTPGGCAVSDGRKGTSYPNLRFALPEEHKALLALLRAERPRRVEIHHLLGHAPEVACLPESLDVPGHVHVHDYAWLCPRIALLGREGRHCAEPAADLCAECVDDLGVPDGMPRDAAALRRNSAAILERASRVVTSCGDAAARIHRHFPSVSPEIHPWEEPPAPLSAPVPRMPKAGPATVAVLGAIGPEKGFDVLLACARDAARRQLGLRFVLIGHSSDDDRLLRTGSVFVTGHFQEGEAAELLCEHEAELGFVPSVVPETWCYALSELRRAGLQVMAFDLGAQAERLRANKGSLLLPLGLPPGAINDALLQRLRPEG